MIGALRPDMVERAGCLTVLGKFPPYAPVLGIEDGSVVLLPILRN